MCLLLILLTLASATGCPALAAEVAALAEALAAANARLARLEALEPDCAAAAAVLARCATEAQAAPVDALEPADPDGLRPRSGAARRLACDDSAAQDSAGRVCGFYQARPQRCSATALQRGTAASQQRCSALALRHCSAAALWRCGVAARQRGSAMALQRQRCGHLYLQCFVWSERRSPSRRFLTIQPAVLTDSTMPSRSASTDPSVRAIRRSLPLVLCSLI